MPYCKNCGKGSDPEKAYMYEGYSGDYFCNEECRAQKRSQEASYGTY